MDKFKKWLEQCPVEYDEIHETGVMEKISRDW